MPPNTFSSSCFKLQDHVSMKKRLGNTWIEGGGGQGGERRDIPQQNYASCVVPQFGIHGVTRATISPHTQRRNLNGNAIGARPGNSHKSNKTLSHEPEQRSRAKNRSHGYRGKMWIVRRELIQGTYTNRPFHLENVVENGESCPLSRLNHLESRFEINATARMKTVIVGTLPLRRK